MIDLPEAHKLVAACLSAFSGDFDLTIMERDTIIDQNYFIFFYQTKAFLESKDINDAILGNAPILFDRYSGEVHVTGSTLPLEEYISAWRRTGDCSRADR